MDSNFSQKSYWLSTVPYQPDDRLRGAKKVDVAIIGGGFTGLSTAYHIKSEDSGKSVAILESEVIGYGASGRNGGFSMTLFGLTMSLTGLRFGREKAREAHHYMERAVDYLDEIIKKHNLKCDYEFPGFLRVATTPAYEKRIKHEIELAHSLGIEGIEWIDRNQVRSQVNSELYRGAWWEPRCGLLNPAKLAWEMKGVVKARGVQVYENSPVKLIKRKRSFHLFTDDGEITAEKIVFATNAYSHLIPQLRSKQVPAFTHIVLTEPLTPEQMTPIGWKNRQGIEDARNLVHYYRLTIDNRLLMGGGNIRVAFGKNMNRDLDYRVFNELQNHVHLLFPHLKGIKFTHKWGGPVSVTMDMAPAIGYLGDERAVYSLGCIGHGVSMTHLNGKTVSELIFEKKTDLTDLFFVNRKTIPWPPEPFRLVLSHAIRSYMRAEDNFLERKMG